MKSCLDTAIRILTRRDHSEFELIQKLKLRGFTVEDCQEIIEKLKAYRYLDEERYTESKIRHLLQKGFSNEIIIAKLRAEKISCTHNEIDDIRCEIKISVEDQINTLKEKKRYDQDDPKERAKWHRYLASKGHYPSF